MMLSLKGLLGRMKGRKDQMYSVSEFLKHYKEAKNAFKNGDTKTVKEFFDLYVV